MQAIQTHVLMLAVSFVLSAYSLRGASEFCALRVKVRNPEGKPVRTRVDLKDQAGRILHRTMSDDTGIATFCDLGFDLYDLVVGSDLCGQVVVRYLYQIWPETRDITVVYQNCHSNLPSSGCYVLWRIQGPDGRPLMGVSFTGRELTLDSLSDSYGRLMGFVPWRRRLEGFVGKLGFRNHPVRFDCRPERKYMIEETILLEPAQR